MSGIVELNFSEFYDSKLFGYNSGTLEISTPLKIVVRTQLHAGYGTKTSLVFLTADGEASVFSR